MVSAVSASTIRIVSILPIAILAQIFLGGLVAGLDAGMGYPTWPLMDGAIIPGGLMIMDPAWRNFFENALTVQFNHRVLAYLIILYAGWMILRFWLRQGNGAALRDSVILMALLLVQAAVGIFTLFYQVPLDLALTHQGGAFVILAFVTVWLRRLTASR